MTTRLDTYAVASALRELGIPTIPTRDKTPAVAWKRYQEELPDDGTLRRFFVGTRHNVAAILGNAESGVRLVGFDIDDVAKRDLVLRACGPTPVMNRTPSGGEHWVYRAADDAGGNRAGVCGVRIDVRFGANGILLIPPSRLPNGAYVSLGTPLHEIGSVGNLPTASITWAVEPTRREVSRNIEPVADGGIMFRRARGWIACVEGAVSGHGGHARTFRVACKLTHRPPRGFGLSFDEAMALMREWNEHCEPPWSERELAHKVSDALTKR